MLKLNYHSLDGQYLEAIDRARYLDVLRRMMILVNAFLVVLLCAQLDHRVLAARWYELPEIQRQEQELCTSCG